MGSGYANRIIHLKFPALSEDPETDPIWVAIRNPRLMPPNDLRPKDVPLDAEGKPLNEDDAMRATFEIVARLVVGWRVYDASVLEVDPDTGVPVDQPMLPSPATPELAAKLPTEIINRISTEMVESANPK